MSILQKARDLTGWIASAAGRAQAPASVQGAGRVAVASQEVPEATRQALIDQRMDWASPFSPGAPLPPYEGVGAPPIRYQFQVGQNAFLQPRASAGVDYSVMSEILGAWDIAQLCINTRIDHLRLPDWIIDARDREDNQRYASELRRLREFFERPDGESEFDTWLAKWLRDWLSYDAAFIFRHRTRGGKIAAYEVIDGRTISMLVDGRGAMPRPPAPAYVQWAWGLPWTWLTSQDVLYEPYWSRSGSRYGLPPIEWLLMQGNTDVRLQLYFLHFFTEGEIPAVFMNAPEDVATGKQLDELQAKYDAMLAGKVGIHHRVIFIPHGATPHQTKELKFDKDQWNAVIVKACSSFGVQPAEIGITENVNKASSAAQEDIQYRRSILPSALYVQQRINRLLREDFNAPWARFRFRGIEEESDRLKLAQVDEILIRNGVKSPDEAAQERGLPTDPAHPVGRLLITRTGAILLNDAPAVSAAQAQQAAAGVGADANDLADEEEEDDAQGAGEIEGPSGITPVGEIRPKPVQSAQGKAAHADLRKWRDLAVSRCKAGKAQRAFVSDEIPAPVRGVIEPLLAKAATVADVRAAFAPWIGGEPPPLD